MIWRRFFLMILWMFSVVEGLMRAGGIAEFRWIPKGTTFIVFSTVYD